MAVVSMFGDVDGDDDDEVCVSVVVICVFYKGC